MSTETKEEAASSSEQDAAFVVELQDYILSTGPGLFSLSSSNKDAFQSKLKAPETEELLKSFVVDSQLSILIVLKIVHRDAEDKVTETFAFDTQLKQSHTKSGGLAVAFVKASPSFDPSRPISAQLFVCQINEKSPFQSILSYVRHCFVPLSRSLGSNDNSNQGADNVVIRSVATKLGELEVELLRSQQTIEVPQVLLEVHPVIAAVAEKKDSSKLETSDFPESDASFLNDVQKGLGTWKKQIVAVTRLDWDVSTGTTMQEIGFWSRLDARIDEIQNQLKNPLIEFTFKLLNDNKRFHATTGFSTDTGLKVAKDKTTKYCALLRDFPIKTLLAASDIEQMIVAIETIFNHLKQIRRIEYPLSRAALLIHTISRDIALQIRSVLKARGLANLPYDEFDKVTKPTEKLFRTWTDQLEAFVGEIRELTRKQRDQDISPTTRPHQQLEDVQQRISEIRRIRKQHHDLQMIITNTLTNDNFGERTSCLNSLMEAYNEFRQIDLLDTTPAGVESWKAAQASYNKLIGKVDTDLENKIRELLTHARNDSNEMFRVCAKFNALFERPRIKAAIREYQDHLIETVKKDISVLQDKYKLQFERSEALRMSRIHDIPPCSGSIIWSKQIERQLDIYLQRIEDVLGKRWHNYVEGRRLKAETDQFRKKLQPGPLFQEWLSSINDLDQFDVEDRIFKIVSIQQETTLTVNFDRRMVTLFKEVRNLGRLGQRVPYEARITASEAQDKYPFAVRLEEVIRVYSRTCQRLSDKRDLSPLAAVYKKAVQERISKGLLLQWDYEKLKEYVDRLGQAALEFQDKVDELISRHDVITSSLVRLESCKPTRQNLSVIIKDIQDVIDSFDKGGFSNLGIWIEQLDKQVEDVLVRRLKEIIQFWRLALDYSPNTVNAVANAGDDDNKAIQSSSTTTGVLDFVPQDSIKHEIQIRNQMLTIEPPLDNARLRLVKDFQVWLGHVLNLPRLNFFWTTSSSAARARGREAKGQDAPDATDTFRSALSKVDMNELSGAFQKVEQVLVDAKQYVSTWMQYQALWDMTFDQVTTDLGDDIKMWEKIILDMKRSRATFDTSVSHKYFGPVLIDFAGVQAKVNEKYDYWYKNLLSRFGQKVGELLVSMSSSMTQAKDKLEKASLDFTSTAEIVSSVTLLTTLNSSSKKWRGDLEIFKGSEKLLTRQRYNFPSEWLSVELVTGTYSKFEQLLSRQLTRMHLESPNIQANLSAEDASLNNRVKELIEEWKAERPIQGDLDHSTVASKLDRFSLSLNRLEEDLTRLNQAKAAMEMPTREEVRLVSMKEELTNLREVWDKLGTIWRQIDTLKETLFRNIKPPDLRKALTNMQADMGKLPNHMRTYSAYDHLKNIINNYLLMNGPMFELNSGTLRPKHQKLILKEINYDIPWSELTVGKLWECDLKVHMKAIRVILEQAQGESALEEYLSELSNIWEHFKLDLVDYRNKCFLIRNWDAIFLQLNDHLSSLSAMKQSPWYGAFEPEAAKWEEMLNRCQTIFDIFQDVQKKWVYLEGIFNNSIDVQQQLVYQYKKFKTFDNDFVKLMREIKRDPSVLLWIKSERNLQAQMQGFLDILNGIQKALGEYLEKQRSAFPRFYFVGDEDLLEIIGNAKNPVKVIRHLPKMFAGIASLKLSENGMHIHGMESREGECILFRESIAIAETPSIQGWLSKVQYQMQFSLACLLDECMSEMRALSVSGKLDPNAYFAWADKYSAQLMLLATQIGWSEQVEAALSKADAQVLAAIEQRVKQTLDILADRILLPALDAGRRAKYEQLVTEMVHQRDVTRSLITSDVRSENDYQWLSQMRFYFRPQEKDVLKKLQIRISRASFFYGFEYLGVGEKLVQTPLTDRCYLTLCESLHMRLGGNPFGPAGTGKTETVKALGAQLGRFVLVFNCDETFDDKAMTRIFIGLAQCGAWGCFDEFNRLEERILSAVSQQILTIQTGLREQRKEIVLLDNNVTLNPQMGIFVTMNPGYAGRSNLPDNLKQLFRGIAMIQPDRRLISQVMLYSQGFRTAEDLSGKVVLLFQLCQDQLSNQPHYDFGLRAVKSVLRSAGALKREELANEKKQAEAPQTADSKALSPRKSSAPSLKDQEVALVIRSICETMVPKFVASDIPLFSNLLTAVFPNSSILSPRMDQLRDAVTKLCRERCLIADSGWMDKVLQVCQIQHIHHGVIMVGPSGTGKSCAWNILADALEKVDGVKTERYVIDPKALSKEELYGVLDPTTLEWTNGVFTATLRKIIDNARGESAKRHWIVFDGDVDPEWAENLNSVLDDNKLLTLPNGERLALTANVRIMFEVKDLQHATLATVSRCGMVWFSEHVVSTPMIMSNMLMSLRAEPITQLSSSVYSRWKQVQVDAADIMERYFDTIDYKNTVESKEDRERAAQENRVPLSVANKDSSDSSFVTRCLSYIATLKHVMEFDRLRLLSSLFSLLKAGIVRCIEYNDNHLDFPLSTVQLESYLSKYLVFATHWAFGGSLSLADRVKFCNELLLYAPPSIALPKSKDFPIMDFEVRVDTQDWVQYNDRVEQLDLEAHKIIAPDVVIDTVDTFRHTDVVSMWLKDHRPIILVGPPGSGKSMTLTSVLRNNPQFELVTLNFASSTKPDLLMRTFDHYCKIDRTPNGLVMRPTLKNKWLVIFCDEINLPANDKYHTQHVITFLRQLIEHGGFWRASDLAFVTLERVQIVGAGNPPTDAGRVKLSPRFLRHCPLLFVDFPAAPSLKQIYGTFNRALFKLVPPLRGYSDALTDAMIEFYLLSQERFTPDVQPHYIYSPRELTRWTRAMYEAMKVLENMKLEELVRLWLHEALRLFQDRLVEKSERQWTDETLDRLAVTHFPQIDAKATLFRPVLYSNWLSKMYMSVDQEKLREHVKARLHVFNEEELDVKLVIFDEVLEHILRIDRVLRQPLGHMLLVGASGAGKTILSKFVSWMNGMSTFQIKVHKNYSSKDFDKDLRNVLTRSGCKAEKICFIFDESNVLNTAFLERMNALLASGEVPGLFENADFKSLMIECREAAKRDGIMIDSEEELYSRFCSQVQRNLHVVFTMNPSNEDFDNRSATSPALFNRCVIDWFGEWSTTALYQVGFEFTRNLDLGDTVDGKVPETKKAFTAVPGSQRDSVVSTLVYVHESVQEAMIHLSRQGTGRSTYVTPRHYLDFIKHYQKLFVDKREHLEDQQRHLNTGLRQLKQTEEQVQSLKTELTEKSRELEAKNKDANSKLNQMLLDQRDAEQKSDVSKKLAEEIKLQETQISARRVKVEAQLASAEPALRAAEASVKSIKRQDLVELKSMRRPPEVIRLAVEPVVLLLGVNLPKDKDNTWDECVKVLLRQDFIKNVVELKTEQIPEKVAARIRSEYMTQANFTEEKVYNASKACAPLVSWVVSQINFKSILESVEPLEQEMKSLEGEATKLHNRQDELNKMIDTLSKSITRYKDEYALLISDAQKIKVEMEMVKRKVERSVALLQNLGSERERWDKDSKNFQDQIATIVGDCLVSAAFIAYIGYFNQSYRRTLTEKWQDRLTEMKVACKPELSVIEYLSLPGDRLKWQSNKLPDDELCTENAIMIHHFNRYPLIIDPSGQATDFMMTHFKDRKIIRTSFLDDAFLKNLESALRFGNALLVEDVESMDPVLNSVLNREISKTGGRVMITLGDKEIDFSPTFVIFLATRDPTVHFTPDLCSRVTFVNFTVTHSSLTTQCLSKILKTERPDIDRKRSDLLKLQGEFQIRLRQLEDSLLEALNSVQGNILDDENVMASLESLKKEAGEVTRKMSESEVVMGEIHDVSDVYRPFATACSRFYFTLENLASVHFLYQFSLSFFLVIVDFILSHSPRAAGKVDRTERLRALTDDLFWIGFQRTARGLLQADHISFSLRLVQLYLDDSPRALNPVEIDFFLKNKLSILPQMQVIPDFASDIHLTKAKKMSLQQLISLPGFSNLLSHIGKNAKAWAEFMNPNSDPEKLTKFDEKTGIVEFLAIPTGWERASTEKGVLTPVSRLFHQLMLTKILRPDLTVTVAGALVTTVFGAGFMDQTQKLDLPSLVEKETDCHTPLLMVSRPGYDASGRVDSLASHAGKDFPNYQSFAMGSPQGYALADDAIKQAAKQGYWVLLKNVHLSPQWLNKLEKSLHIATPHPNFRLFMTMELNPNVPVNLLRMSNVLIFEPPVGIKSSLLRTFSRLPPERVNKAPVERSRLYFLLAWFHAVVLERLRYVPVGWAKTFEFGEADQQCTMDAIDEWVDKCADGRANLAPNKIPWGALQALLNQIIYGGRIDNEFDQERLDAFVKSLFGSAAFNLNFPLCLTFDSASGPKPLLSIPDASSYQGFMNWINALSEITTPEMLGLPQNAELILLAEHSKATVRQLLSLQDQQTDGLYAEITEEKKEEPAAAPRKAPLLKRASSLALSGRRSSIQFASDNNEQPAWMVEMAKQVDNWLKRLPAPLKPLMRDVTVMNDPLFRAFEREVTTFGDLLRMVRADLTLAASILSGKEKATNPMRELFKTIQKDKIPKGWRAYTVEDMTVSLWIDDFSHRIELLQKLSSLGAGRYGRNPFWLGGLRNPEAFHAASRQAVAQSHSWSLEQLYLQVTVVGDPNDKASEDSFVYEGLTLFGASWKDGALSLSNEVAFNMPPTRFTWLLSDGKNRDKEAGFASLPVYLNTTRTNFLFSVRLKCPLGLPANVWSQRGTCITVWQPHA